MADAQDSAAQPERVTELQGKVVKAPYPTDEGYVLVEILAEDGVAVRGICCEAGYGSDVGPEGSVKHTNLAMRTVSDLNRSDALMPLVQEAHRMRKAAGKSNALYDLSRRGTVIEPPVRSRSLKVESHGVLYDVHLHELGSVLEWVDNWEITTEDGRHDACTAGICWVLEHPEKAAALGVDVDLYRLYYE
ncbi:MAG: hypothetical protein R3B07_06975 [Polyangiaceae bacterium]